MRRGHRQSILDWEIHELYRRVRDRAGGNKEEIEAKIRRTYWEMCAKGRDTVFFVGNLSGRPRTFVIIGIFWPPKPEARLFDD